VAKRNVESSNHPAIAMHLFGSNQKKPIMVEDAGKGEAGLYELLGGSVLLDDLVGTDDNCYRNINVESLSDRRVHDHFKGCWLLHRKL
jgi:hypothetical protein